MKKKIAALLLALALGASLGLSAFAEETEAPAEKDTVAGPDAGAEYHPDPLGAVSFAAVEQRARRNNLQILALDQQIAALEDIDYEKNLNDLRDALNGIASAQGMLLDMGQGSSYSYDKLTDSYNALRRQFDAIWNGDLQEDNAGLIRQLKNLEDQIVLGGETMYMAILSMESQETDLERQLTALDRQLQELELRYKLGQIAALTLTEAKAGRSALASGLETLRMNIRVYKTQLETLLGAEQTGSVKMGGVPQVTAAQLAAMDPEKDLAAAKERSYELFEARKTYEDTRDAYHGIGDYTPSLSAEHGWPAAQYTYRNAVQSYELKFHTLSAQTADYKQVLEAAKVTLESKKASCAASELKFKQGNISQNAFLTAVEEAAAAEEAVHKAENDLFTAYNSYRWAVETGILN